jgi:hypothetical protein
MYSKPYSELSEEEKLAIRYLIITMVELPKRPRPTHS